MIRVRQNTRQILSLPHPTRSVLLRAVSRCCSHLTRFVQIVFVRHKMDPRTLYLFGSPWKLCRWWIFRLPGSESGLIIEAQMYSMRRGKWSHPPESLEHKKSYWYETVLIARRTTRLFENYHQENGEGLSFLSFLRRKEGMYKRPWDWLDPNCQTRLQCCAVASVVGASTPMWDGCSNMGLAQVEISQS